MIGDATIREAMDNPDVFGEQFQGESWNAWKVFASALFGLPMTSDEVEVYQRHTGRTAAPTTAFTEAVLVCGRRAGKSRTLAALATYLATHRDYRPFLAPGEVAVIAIMASDREQAQNIFRFVKGNLAASPLLAGMVDDELSETIALNNRVLIQIKTASFKGTRGFNYAAVLGDEVAFWSIEGSANPDEEILEAVRPGLGLIPGAVLLLASTPYGKRGALFQSHRDNYGKDGAEVLVWQAPTLAMNPLADPAKRAAAFRRDPVKAAREWDAQFQDGATAFVTRETVDACTVPGRTELPKAGWTYSAFVDAAGGSGTDSFTLAIAHREDERAVLDLVREVKPPFSPEATVRDLCEILKGYVIKKVTGDRYAGQWPQEQFRKHGIEYEVSARNRSELYRDTLPLLNSGQVELLDWPIIGTQFCGLVRKTGGSGRDTIDHAAGAHDDVVNSVAGALLLVGEKPGWDGSYDWIDQPGVNAVLGGRYLPSTPYTWLERAGLGGYHEDF